MVNNMLSDPLQKLLHNEVCISFQGTYKDLFKHIEMKKQNIRNHLHAILPYQIYHSTTGMAFKFPRGNTGIHGQ